MAHDPWFDTTPDRRGTWSEKWDAARADELPLWVADMDFAAPPAVLDALRARLDHGVLGYSQVPAELLQAVADHQRQAHGWAVDPRWIVPVPGLVCGLHLMARAIGTDGDGILTATPIYPPFLTAPAASGRRTISVPLDPERAWTLSATDWLAAGDAPTSALWLCQPHNPSGRVYRDDELQQVAQVAQERDLVVISDEIWADLVLDADVAHRPFALACPNAAARSITLTAPSKTWNLPGLGCAFAIIPDPALRRRVEHAKGRSLPDVGIMGLVGAHAAYRDGGTWLTRCRAYLRANRDHLATRLATMPGLRWQPAAATYLAWIDARASGLPDPAAAARSAGVFLSDGRYFGEPGWIRLNFGCARSTLDAACDRLATVFSS